jgi:glycosyltransferase involved in cell wall biosynthesis
MAAFLPRMRGRECPATQTLTLHNVESDLIRRTGSTKLPLAGATFERFQTQSLRRFEQRAVNAADLAFAYSPVDLARYRELYPEATWALTRTGTSASEIVPVEPPQEPKILLTASLAYAPNVHGLEWFVDDILPLLPEDVEITVAGSNASDAVKRLLAATRIKFVDSPRWLTALFASHSLCVLPLLEGSGTRGRIPEALAHGRAIVTTAKGAEGLEFNDSSGVFVERDHPANFANTIVKWLGSPAERQRRAAVGRDIVLRRFDWSVVAAEFAEALQSLVTATPGNTA